MRLNHINLTVSDVPAAVEFLEKYFGLRNQNVDPDPTKFALLFDDEGLVISLISAGRAKVEYPATFHIGFIQPSEERVNEINRRLRDDGFDVAPPQRAHAWTFYVNAPGGFPVEVLT